MNIKNLILVVIFLFIIFSPKNIFSQHQHISPKGQEKPSYIEKKVKFWTCSMHPQIKLPNPGKCPICFMDLIPVYEEKEVKKGLPIISFTEQERKFAEIETSTVQYRDLIFEIKLLGKIEYDETKIANISAWIPGRVDKLYLNFVGAYVKKGEPIFQIYSPELITAQQEYLIALRRYQSALESKNEEEIYSSKIIKQAVEKKLELFGILPEQIKEIEKRGYATDKMDIYAPISGVIIERDVFEGKYFNTGDVLFKIADLSSLWIKLDVYEKDIPYVGIGQKVIFITESFPNQIFSGKVVFIDPFINEKTRTFKVRLEIYNPEGKLKPGMFGHAILKKNLGKKLSIPATAPLLTGKRAVVYVEVKPNVFEGREVVLGRKAGDFYPVISGLKLGEKVVTKGNFKIDASLQIQAKPSMMKLQKNE
ncbi:MAG: efflux RND transporter periplasmic adaptor subunit [Candidatus Omnitrophica bacterium]|nr:efflux RND transporter periplasmic adaptor subunit [Candidatus Omnitrophota bacterium]